MPLTLAELPPDIILEIVKYPRLEDVISLLRTCSTLYALTNNRIFWISVLKIARLYTSLACPMHADLSDPQYDAPALKGIAMHQLKRELNWSRPVIGITKQLVVVQLPMPFEIILIVQGTDILLVQLHDANADVVLWDVALGLPYPLPAVSTEGYIVLDTSSTCESQGVCTVALLTEKQFPPFTLGNLHLITIFHKERKAIRMECTRTRIPSEADDLQTLFLGRGIVGCSSLRPLVGADDRVLRCILCSPWTPLSLSDAAIFTMEFNMPLVEDDVLQCLSYEGHLYNMAETGEHVHLQHISRNSAKSGRSQRSDSWNCPISTSYDGSARLLPFSLMFSGTPFYGVAAVFIRSNQGLDLAPDLTPTLAVTFLPCPLTYAPDDGDASPLAFLPCDTAVFEVRPFLAHMRGLVWTDNSGLNVIVGVERPDAQFGLKLIRYHAEFTQSEKATSVHDLEVPTSVDAESLVGVALDETSGMVLLTTDSGELVQLCYV
ncbi:F-box domain-containing protein [Mycena kentingensis (nom. inval.)]|nr:F-box domain-containing protein [Mycena kentingensis (nom. inval.)]